MASTLIQSISKYVTLEEEQLNDIRSNLVNKQFKKGELLLKEGMIAQLSYFNVKGCVRMYYLVDGEEKTTWFYTENQFITSFKSFTDQIPSDHYLECVEDCTLTLIPFELERKLLQKYPPLETFSRITLEQEMAKFQKMLSNYLLLTPEQRYKDLLENQPQLLQRVPLFQLASYIGVKAESLSRIRNRLAKKSS